MAQPKKPKPSPDEQLMAAYLSELDNTPSKQQVTCSRLHYQWMAQQINALRTRAESFERDYNKLKEKPEDK